MIGQLELLYLYSPPEQLQLHSKDSCSLVFYLPDLSETK